MGKRQRKIPARKKLELVLEGLQSDNIARFCRQHDISDTQFYNWKNKLIENGPEIFNGQSKKDPEKERLKKDLKETKETLVEVTKERQLLKKKDILGF